MTCIPSLCPLPVTVPDPEAATPLRFWASQEKLLVRFKPEQGEKKNWHEKGKFLVVRLFRKWVRYSLSWMGQKKAAKSVVVSVATWVSRWLGRASRHKFSIHSFSRALVLSSFKQLFGSCSLIFGEYKYWCAGFKIQFYMQVLCP